MQDDASAERERDEFRRKRQEIEDQLKTRNAEVKDRRNSGILGGTVSSLELSAAGGVAEEPKKKKKRTDVEETNMMQVDTAEIVAGDREQSPPKKKKKKEKKREESALERMKREKAEETDRRATLSDEDEEMRSAVVSESEQENGIEVDGTGTPRTQLVSSFAPTADNCAVDGQSSTFRMVGGEVCFTQLIFLGFLLMCGRHLLLWASTKLWSAKDR